MLITPAKSHPEVIIQAVAARDKQKAVDYAKKYGIPQVIDSYEGMAAFNFPAGQFLQKGLDVTDRCVSSYA